jgi:hypothetical protein
MIKPTSQHWYIHSNDNVQIFEKLLQVAELNFCQALIGIKKRQE